MSASSDTIYQTSDLVNRRTEFVEAARNGCARMRDKDGMSLVMLPESHVATLELIGEWASALLRLEVLLRREIVPTVTDLGDLAWLRTFDIEDLREFVDELRETLLAAHADKSAETLVAMLGAWRTTARQLEDPLRRATLLGSADNNDFVDATRPE